MYVCSGSNTSTQTINANNATVTTVPGFSVNAPAGSDAGLSIVAAGALSYTDTNASALNGSSSGSGLNIGSTGASGATPSSVIVNTNGDLSGWYGLWGSSSGTGATISITTTGEVVGSVSGMIVQNFDGTDLTIHATNVTGAQTGIYAQDTGTGIFSITTTGQVTGTGSVGISGSSTGNGSTINVANVTGGTKGISFFTIGTGPTSVTATGLVEGVTNAGIEIGNYGQSSSLAIEAVDVIGGQTGISATNQGVGPTSITTTGQVTGTAANGIDALNEGTATDLIIDAAGVTGGQTGINATNQGTGSGKTDIQVSGMVTGTGQYGINAATNSTGGFNVTTASNALVQGGVAGVSVNSATDQQAVIDNAGTIQNLSAASDALAITSAQTVATTIKNSGLVQGTVNLAGTGANHFTNQSGGVWNTAGGTNNFGGMASNNGIDNQSGATIVAAAAGAAAPVTTTFNGLGTFNNAGKIAMQNGVVGDRTVITGAYVGQGISTITLDTTLGSDGSPSDLLVIDGGKASGSTKLDIENVGGAGAATTGNGIMVVNAINGATTESTAFSLAHAVAVNAFDYALYYSSLSPSQADQNWYLRSTGKLNPSSQTALPYADVLSNFAQATLGTLQQRTGNRIWPDGTAAVAANLPPAGAMAYAKGGPALIGQGAWGRMGGQYSSFGPRTGSAYNQSIGFLQAGYEGVARETAAGDLTIGAYAITGTSTARIDVSNDPVTGAARAKGRITTRGYGIGANLTWLGHDGLYADAIGQFTWYDSSLSNKNGHNQGWSSALSLEVGKRYELGSGWAVVPQAQLAWTHVDFSSFTDNLGNRIALGQGDSLQGRAGLRLEHLSSWQDATGQTARLQFYGIANLTYEFLKGRSVKVSGASLVQGNRRLWGEVGAGATYSWNKNWSAYGEANYAMALSGKGGDNYTLKGTAGVRYRW
ncbi:autotransporter outer membrane beta-barrel domain-containing protein [Labrys sp. KNU-23]|uniref:autotransporter family protein n=1 Tax=Labrys sp. KNU-23 TaxID=2789216 RepID=UPI00165ADCFA|nr:autotransporter outer membrane beta-barrel domain-containing protein [Labrys sp. KNU-23]